MDRARLLSHFDTLADTPDAVAKLRELVLSLAVRGKLVAQSPADESADALVRITQALAQKIAREERIKLPTPELPIGETDKVFALPVGWAWVKVGSICLKLGAGSTPLGGKQVYEKTGIKFLRSQNIWNEGLHLDDVAFIPPSVHADMSATCVRPGDILLNITGASIGRSAVVPDDFDHANVSQHVSIVRLADRALRHFIHLYIIAPDFQKRVMAVQVGVSREGLSMARLKEFVVPLPPLAEQKRIVARVEELLALCEELEARQTAAREQRTRLVHSAFDHLTAARDESEFRKHSAFCLQHSNLLFDSVPALRQAILSLAVQGKLGTQDSSDEPADQVLARMRAKYGEVEQTSPDGGPAIEPFSIPNNWCWASFPELGEFARGKSKHRPRNDPILYSGGKYPLVQTGDVARARQAITTHTGLYNEAGLAQSRLWPVGTLCITIAANIADSGILGIEACFPDSVVGFIPDGEFGGAKYFEIFMRTAKAHLQDFAPSTAQKNINLGVLENVRIPLPSSVATQQAIVAEIEAEQKLVAANRELIERFEKKIQSTLARIWGEPAPSAPPS